VITWKTKIKAIWPIKVSDIFPNIRPASAGYRPVTGLKKRLDYQDKKIRCISSYLYCFILFFCLLFYDFPFFPMLMFPYYFNYCALIYMQIFKLELPYFAEVCRILANQW
jgi:hypothetical protein